MTEEIDLDDLDVAPDDEDTPNSGDWFWRGEGDPAAEPDGAGTVASDVDPATAGTGSAASAGDAEETGPESDQADASENPVPHVPRENKDKPVGIPKESGGAGGEAAAAGGSEAADGPEQTASGPHGGGIDDMTMALTYRAAKRLAEPLLAVQDARGWTDWIGIVGDVEAYVINKYQRENNVDIDFFSGSGQTAAERLADIDEHSMFYAERMVVVGLPEESELAERVGWEFVPLSDAAAKADWHLTEDAD